MTNSNVDLAWKKGRKIKGKQVTELLLQDGNVLRDDFDFSKMGTKYIQTANNGLFFYSRGYDVTTGNCLDSKLKGMFFDDINDYLIIHADLIRLSRQLPQHVVVPHNYYFKTWDDSGKKYIADLLTVMPVKPELLDFSPESLLAIDRVIKRKKLPDDVLEDSIFLPAVVGYCGVHLERFQNRTILIDHNKRDDIYEPYYMNGDRKESLYVRFYEEALENDKKFSLDFIVDVNFF